MAGLKTSEKQVKGGGTAQKGMGKEIMGHGMPMAPKSPCGASYGSCAGGKFLNEGTHGAGSRKRR